MTEWSCWRVYVMSRDGQRIVRGPIINALSEPEALRRAEEVWGVGDTVPHVRTMTAVYAHRLHGASGDHSELLGALDRRRSGP